MFQERLKAALLQKSYFVARYEWQLTVLTIKEIDCVLMLYYIGSIANNIRGQYIIVYHGPRKYILFVYALTCITYNYISFRFEHLISH